MPLELKSDLRVEYVSGNRYNPADPFGEVVLVLQSDGHVRIDNYLASIYRVWEGKVRRETIEKLLASLNAAGFPAVPEHPIPADSAMRVVRVQTGGSEVRNYPVEWHAAMEMPGYREAFRLLDSIVVELSGNGLCVLCAPDTGLVSDAHFVP